MSDALAHIVWDIYRRAVERVLPETVISKGVRLQSENRLEIDGWNFDISDRPVHVIAVGKAAGEMTVAVESILGERFTGGIMVTKSLDNDLKLRSRVLLGSHPVPDEQSLEAGDSVLKFARDIPDVSLVLCLISGGGSALMESLRPGVSLEDLQRTTRLLLNAGASIHELNAVRARMSEIKAGGLLAQLNHVEVVNLIISDVLGDDLTTIASGPTVPRTLSERAEDVLQRYGVDQLLPEDVAQSVSATPKTVILANLGVAIEAACGAAREHGLEPAVLSRSLSGEARHVATTLAGIVADTVAGVSTFPRKSCIIAGGETTVTVRGDGTGGRNTECALAAAIRLQGVDNIAMGFLATDGDDAETNVAGGIVTGATITSDNIQAAHDALDRNDTFTFLDGVGSAWGNGPTGTNVNDLVIGIVG
ncbi:glycerate kinase [soil metagenome]